MTLRYVSHLGSNTSPFDTMVKAATTLIAAGQVAGDIVRVASDHTETAAGAITLPSGTQGSPIVYISVNRSTEVYETMVIGGGLISTAATADLALGQWHTALGLKFFVGDDIIGVSARGVYFIDSSLEVKDNIFNTTASAHTASIFLENTHLVQKTAGNIYLSRLALFWKGGSYSVDGGSIATYVLNTFNAEGSTLHIEGVDFQDLDGSDYLSEAPDGRCEYYITGCKVPAAAAGLLSGTIINPHSFARFHNVTNENILIALTEYYYTGIITDETAIYTGASELSIEFAANANVDPGLDGLEFTHFYRKCDANPTFEIELNTDEATALTDNDVYLKIFGPDDIIGALSLLTSTKAADINNPTTLTSSSTSWTGTGGFTNEQKRKITKTLSGYQAGVYKIVVVVAKNITAYVDIDVTVS